jgi:hypothetical protein
MFTQWVVVQLFDLMMKITEKKTHLMMTSASFSSRKARLSIEYKKLSQGHYQTDVFL